MHQRLKTRNLLSARGMQIDISCPLCNNANESCMHLFFTCSYTKAVWKTVLQSYGVIRDPMPFNAEVRWLKTICKGRNARAKLVRLLLSCTVYMIWWERNKLLHFIQARTIKAEPI